MKLSDNSIHKHFDTALLKIRSVLRNTEKEFITRLDHSIEVIPKPAYKKEEFPNHFMPEIQQAIVHKQVLSITYYSYYNEAYTKRKVEPIGLYYYGSGWHLIAFCRLRKDYRDFRIDRIKTLSYTGETFVTENKDSLQTYIYKLTQSTELAPITVRFDKKVIKYLHEQKYLYGFVEDKDMETQVEMTFVTSYPEYFGRWLLSYGSAVEIVCPDGLKEIMIHLAAEVKSHYLLG